MQPTVFKHFLLMTVVALSLTLFSCDPCAKMAKSTDIADRDSAAFCYFEREKYEPASQIFSELLGFYAGSERGEKVLYYLASSKMYMGEMLTAGYFFEQFIKSYPNSKYAEDATYFRAYVYYLMSDVPELDQTETYKALELFQFFIKVYPESERVAKAERYIKEMRDKLARKALRQAELYYKMEYYQAANVAFSNLVQDYPDAEFREEVQYKRLRSAVIYAEKSIEEKQYERFQQAKAYYYNFVDTFGGGEYAGKAEKLLPRIDEGLQEAVQPNEAGLIPEVDEIDNNGRNNNKRNN